MLVPLASVLCDGSSIADGLARLPLVELVGFDSTNAVDNELARSLLVLPFKHILGTYLLQYISSTILLTHGSITVANLLQKEKSMAVV